MVPATLKKFATGLGPVVGVTLLMLASLKLMSDATENSATFGELYSWLLLVNVLGLIMLAGLIAANLYRLLTQLRNRVAGARLTARMVIMFVVLAVTPVLLVYYFSIQFLHRGIDSWFDVRVEQALNDALELSRTALGVRMRELHKRTESMADRLQAADDSMVAILVDDLRENSGPTELTVLSAHGHIIASSTADPTRILPDSPDEAVLLQVRQLGSYIGLDTVGTNSLQVRVLVTISDRATAGESRVLQALFPVTERINDLADSVQSAFAHYRELAYLRNPLKKTFTLTLSMALLLSLLGAVWAAFHSARRLAAPIRDLAQGTLAVAKGDYETQLPRSGKDEMGFLVQSFNEMTRKLALARDETRRSRKELEAQHTYLEAVLARLSSGVVTFDQEHRLHTSNNAANQILGVDLGNQFGRTPEQIGRTHPNLAALTEVFQRRLAHDTVRDWREEVSLFGAGGRQMLMCRGTLLTGTADTSPGHVIVFDDITALVQAQKNAAWGEVARRLAHEIKNPLTPIRLSAERLRHKYLPDLGQKDQEVFARLTHTIIQQVESMKAMVNAFSEYARSPRMNPELIDINELISEVLELYRYNDRGTRIESRLSTALPSMEVDPGRMRQLVHNLVKNALEAPDGDRPRVVTVRSRNVRVQDCDYVEISVEDNGRGFPPDIMDQVFEPYVTTKSKGSGLGLAIVKKIVEEHSGMVTADNRTGQGARVRLRFPSAAEAPRPANADDRMRSAQ